nr:F-box only protein 8-like [Ipomoea batatas]
MEASSASIISCITCLPREILVKILSGLPAKCAVRFSWTDAALHIHGIIYFIPNITEQESSSKIVAMDVATEKSRQRAQRWVPWIKLNGRLAFIDIITNIPTREREDDDPHPDDPAESKIEIWTLEIRSMEEEEWEKQTVLLPLEESELIEQATSIGFTSNSVGEILILLRSKIIISPLILIYSFRRDVWRRIEIRGASKYSSYFSDMESVVHVDDEITGQHHGFFCVIVRVESYEAMMEALKSLIAAVVTACVQNQGHAPLGNSQSVETGGHGVDERAQLRSAVEAVAEVLGGFHAPLGISLAAGAALGAQAVPEKNGDETIREIWT